MRALLLLPFLVAGPALASCPTVANLRDGVVLVQNAPYFLRSDVELQGFGLLDVRVTKSGDEPATVTLMTYDHALAPDTVRTGAGRTEFQYQPGVQALLDLDSKGEVRLAVTRRNAQDQESKAQLLFTHQGEEQITIQSCTYNVWRVREMRADDDGTITTRILRFAPDLQLVLSVEAPDNPDPTASFAFTWIGTSAEVAR